MAARVNPGRVGAALRSLRHFVAKAAWNDASVLVAVRAAGAAGAVARQYRGQIGNQDNGQVAVSLAIATDHASLPIAFRAVPSRRVGRRCRARAGIPDDVVFRAKSAIALDQIRAAMAAGVPPGVVLMDAGYGNDTDLRDGVSASGPTYVAGVQSSLTVWPPGVEPLPPKPWSGKGRPPKLLRRAPSHDPVPVTALAGSLAPGEWRPVTWREGTNAPLASRFAAVRVRPAHRDYWRSEPRAEEWLLIEWPGGEEKPTGYWLSTLPEATPLDALVETAKLCWRIGRDYLELKQELGLGHYEGRGWRGFHHHATLCIAAHGFLIRERAAIPPSGPAPAGRLQAPELPQGFRPRGAAAPP